jgi:sporulation protein YlmC with PRC-barrel domain
VRAFFLHSAGGQAFTTIDEPQERAMEQFRRTLSARSLIGDKAIDASGQDIGKLEELMIDVITGRIAYAVLSFGGFLGIGDKLFAIPWSAIAVDEARKCLVVNVSREVLERAPGFDKQNWPDLSDLSYAQGIYQHYGVNPYWE